MRRPSTRRRTLFRQRLPPSRRRSRRLPRSPETRIAAVARPSPRKSGPLDRTLRAGRPQTPPRDSRLPLLGNGDDVGQGPARLIEDPSAMIDTGEVAPEVVALGGRGGRHGQEGPGLESAAELL